ncbi:caspase domain-containing protein [Armillaria fumosa]|nr:caspase domain-containing protein [Armillaria fumosa]
MSSPVTEETKPAPHSIDGHKVWAVIIGIDDYKMSPLRACVSDAEMVVKYLSDDLRVPGNHIQLLLSADIKGCTVSENKPPTRANIVNAILGLSTNPGIQRGDNIIIYFAGHGTTYKCDDYYGDRDGTAAMLGNIEALCPMDRGPQHSTVTKTADTNDDESSVTSDPHAVPDISDREINTILTEIARNKGNHITFIVDCCHSAGITRGLMTQEGVRSITPLPSSSIADMFSAADENLKVLDKYQSISKADWRADMDSHVVLAACKEFELAKEVEGDSLVNGVFTRALIFAFKSADLNDKSMTYHKLIKDLPFAKDSTQHPVIAGKHMYSRLWFQDCDSSNIEASSNPLQEPAPDGALRDCRFPRLFQFFYRFIELFHS